MHRHLHSTSSSVYAFTPEIDEWRRGRDQPAAAPLVESPPRVTRRRSYAVAAMAALLALALGGWLIERIRPAGDAQILTPTPLTAWYGAQSGASFSPDGAQVAFSWNGERRDNFDIYIMTVGSTHPLRLTTDPGNDYSPAWSPDGKSIAFLRAQPGEPPDVMLMPALGGADHVLALTRLRAGAGDRVLSWSPDGSWIAVPGVVSAEGASDGISAVAAAGGEVKRLTHPAEGEYDVNPAWSPDGRTLAFARQGKGVGSILLLPLDGNGGAAGDPVRVPLRGFDPFVNGACAWLPDGRSLVFVSNYGNVYRIWRVPREGGAPVLLAGLGERLAAPAVSLRGRRLAYTRRALDTNIWRVSTSGGEPQELISSTRMEEEPQYSLDGRRIVYISNRSGNDEIWLCDRQGGNLVQLTDLKSSETKGPHWSPDGRWIVFDSRVHGKAEVFVVPASGGRPRQLTSEPASGALPVWSPDGKWIVFTSRDSGRWRLLKMPAGGGPALPMPGEGGFAAAFSPDGATLYYTREYNDSNLNVKLYRMPSAGGPEVVGGETGCDRCFAPAPDGVFVLHATAELNRSEIHFYSAGGVDRLIARVPRRPAHGIARSPDGAELLFSIVEQDSRNILLVENFQ